MVELSHLISYYLAFRKSQRASLGPGSALSSKNPRIATLFHQVDVNKSYVKAASLENCFRPIFTKSSVVKMKMKIRIFFLSLTDTAN